MRNFVFIASCIVFLHMPGLCFCQCTVDGPADGSTFGNDATVGTLSWANTANAKTSNNQYASVSIFLTAFSSANTKYLTAENFGFNIPLTASICGIQVDVERFATGITNIIGITLGTISDNSVMIIKNGAITGTEHASGTAWTGTNAYASYGSAADTWGVSTWLPTDINAANFGVAVSANIAAFIGVTLGANIDHIRITVNYDDPGVLSIPLQNFLVIKKQGADLLSWSMQSSDNYSGFIIQRSADQKTWQNIGEMPATASEQYGYADDSPLEGINYYRLMLKNKNGTTAYSYVQSVYRESTDNISVYPSPASSSINIHRQNKIHSVLIRDIQGRTLKLFIFSNATENIAVDVSDLSKGLYLLQADGSVYKFLKN